MPRKLLFLPSFPLGSSSVCFLEAIFGAMEKLHSFFIIFTVQNFSKTPWEIYSDSSRFGSEYSNLVHFFSTPFGKIFGADF